MFKKLSPLFKRSPRSGESPQQSSSPSVDPTPDSTNSSTSPATNNPATDSKTHLLTNPTPFRRRRREARLPQKLVRPLQSVVRHPRFWLFFGLGSGFVGTAIALGLGIHTLEASVTESVDEVLTYAPPETLTIKSADGIVLQEIGPVSHDQLKFWEIPKPIEQAFIASEDRRFEEHKGVDFQGILRAALSNFQAGQVVEGGSTLTQQLARIVFLSQERSYIRKLKEMRLAQKIEQTYPKDQILERYLNLVYLGSGAYGVSDAAWLYFGKPVAQLTIPEAATLAGIVPAPSVYSPFENKESAIERRNAVLSKMAAAGFITEQQAEQYQNSPLTLKPTPLKRFQRQAPYFTDYIRQELPKHLTPEQVKSGGVTVETTLNAQWQKGAEKAIHTAKQYGRYQGFKESALVAIDPRNGQIRAMVGGNDYDKNQFNRVTQAKRQPGSTFKAFVYATAIAAGFSPEKSYQNSEYVVDGYQPENYGDKYTGAMLSIRNALASSVNVVAVRTLIDVGWNPIIKLAHKMGIESELQPTYSLALGSWEVDMLELVSAYGTFANEGVHEPVYGISRIRDRKGNILYQADFKPVAALDPSSTAIMTSLLQGVVNGGTGGAAQIGRPVAGKTGTSDKARDLWFVGYIPQLVAGVWLGNDNNYPTKGASSTAAATWRNFMLVATENMDTENFPPAPKLSSHKATIKAEPVKPRKSYYKVGDGTDGDQSGDRVNSGNGNSDTPRRRRRRRSSDSAQVTADSSTNTTPTRRRRRRSVESAPAAAPSRAAESAPVPAAAPAAPESNSAPLAPPVGKKE